MRKSIPFFLVDAFTDTPFAGNPAGVFFDDDAVLSADDMRQMAGEISLESGFVLPPGDSGADFRLRYFTDVTEVPLCGHDTVAATVALIHTGRLSVGADVVYATGIGLLPVSTARSVAGGVDVTLHQTPRAMGDAVSDTGIAEIARALGCAPGEITASGLPVRRASSGTPFLLVPVASRGAVDAAPASFPAIEAVSKTYEALGVYVFTVEQEGDTVAVWSRSFCPLAGLNEDPVTGSASGALGWYLAVNGILRTGGPDELTIRQGFGGKRGGQARVRVSRGDDGVVARIDVTGTAILLSEGQFTAH